MAVIRAEKTAVIEELKRRFATAKAAVVADFRGLTVAEATKLRKQLRAAKVEYRVVKNTLARLAARQAGLQDLEPILVGPTSIAFSAEDPVAPAKALSEFARENKQLEIRGGLLEGRVIDLAAVRALAALPPRPVLLAQLLGSLQAPLYGLHAVLSAPLRNLAHVLEEVRKRKEQG